MTRADLLTALGDETGADTTVTAVKNKMLRRLNRRHREILSWKGAEHLRRRIVGFTSVADQPLVGLAQVEDVQYLREITNDRELYRRSMGQYRAFNPDPAANTGTPEFYVPIGYQQVALQPSDASRLFWKSTSASDTQNGFVEGAITGGYPLAKTKALTGTTAVDVDTSVTTWERVDKAYLTSVAIGVVTLHEDSGTGTELARIGIGQTFQRYYAFYLDPTPSEAITYTADVIYAVTDLAQDTDEPWLPLDFHDLLLDGALADEFIKKDDSRHRYFDGRWRERSSDLKLRLARMAASQGPTTRTSRLGPWVAAGGF